MLCTGRRLYCLNAEYDPFICSSKIKASTHAGVHFRLAVWRQRERPQLPIWVAFYTEEGPQHKHQTGAETQTQPNQGDERRQGE